MRSAFASTARHVAATERPEADRARMLTGSDRDIDLLSGVLYADDCWRRSASSLSSAMVQPAAPGESAGIPT